MRNLTRTTLPSPTAKKDPHANEDQPSRETVAEEIAHYRELVTRAANDAVRDWDIANNTFSWPEGLRSLLGYEEATKADSPEFWQERVHPGDRGRITALLRDALESNSDRWSGEYRFRQANGTYVHLLERAVICRNAQGAPRRWVGTLMDVTARKQLQDEVARAQKMEAFSQLAGGMAHDFNNFLTTILGYSDLIVTEVAGRGTVAKYISEIRSAAGRAASLSRQLLAFSRRQPLETQVLEVNKVLHNLERSILRLLGENISVICELLDHPAHIKVDPEQFTQIIVNLAVNARDAMPNGGTIHLNTRLVTVTAQPSDPLMPELAPGEYVRISMTDDGIGMDDEIKAHLFEPFFTTKHDGKGSGLGLATSYGIIRQSGGHISLETAAGKGTAVHLYLPLEAPPPPVSYRKPKIAKLPSGDESVLVVEDDRSVRHVAVRTLRMLGYNVVEALRGEDGKRQIAHHHFNLVVSDIVLPDMSGEAFADWTRSHSPQTQVVLVSGYLPDGTRTHEKRDMFFLAKPFDPEQLATTVRAALDAPRS